MNADNQQERFLITHDLKCFLAGVIEGEGKLSVSIKEHPTAKYGYFIDPEFFLYQHDKGSKSLQLAQQVFGTGRISPKAGSENVLVYSISSRRSLCDAVIPFYEKYMRFSASWNTYLLFKEILYLMEVKQEHLAQRGLVRLVKLASRMNPDSNSEINKKLLDNVIKEILRDHTPKSILV